jgi:hypothetical protein
MEKLTITQLSFTTYPGTPDRAILVGLSSGETYLVAGLEGSYCFQRAGYSLNPAELGELSEKPELVRLLQAVGEFYQYWLAGNEEPMTLMLRMDTPILHELYEAEVEVPAPAPVSITQQADILAKQTVHMQQQVEGTLNTIVGDTQQLDRANNALLEAAYWLRIAAENL